MSHKTKVLYFDHTAILGGGEIALLGLVRHIDRSSVDALVVLGQDGPLSPLLAEVVPTFILPLSEGIASTRKDKLGVSSLTKLSTIWGVILYVLALRKFILAHSIDVVHTNSLKADIIGGLSGRLAGCNVVWHIRDRIHEDYLPKSVVAVFRVLMRVIPHHLVSNSVATSLTLGKIPDSRHTVIHDGLELERFKPVSRGYEAAPSSNRAGHTIGLIGRLCRWKGQHVFIQAAAEVRSRFPDCHFLIIGAALFGEMDYEQEIKALTDRLELKESITYTGFTSDIPKMIQDLDVVVHASTSGEPFGQVLIEGMAAAKPVVATNGGGAPEIVKHDETGLLVPMGDAVALADAICSLLANPVRAQEMGSAGLKRVQQYFRIEQTAKKVEAVYQKLSNRPKSAQPRRGYFPASLESD